MKSWYQTREAVNVRHRNQTIPARKKILLTPQQADLHNSPSEQVVKSEPPKDATEAGVIAEYKEWLQANEQLAGFQAQTSAKKSQEYHKGITSKVKSQK